MMRHFIFILFASIWLCSYADPEIVVLNPAEPGRDHFDLPIPADEPDVYYDRDVQQIIVDGMGYVSYYDVEITSQSTWDVVVSTSVNGSYDTIDISSLPDDDYIITIDSPLGNTYEGYFTNY